MRCIYFFELFYFLGLLSKPLFFRRWTFSLACLRASSVLPSLLLPTFRPRLSRSSLTQFYFASVSLKIEFINSRIPSQIRTHYLQRFLSITLFDGRDPRVLQECLQKSFHGTHPLSYLQSYFKAIKLLNL